MKEGDRFYYRGSLYKLVRYADDGSAIARCDMFSHQVYRFSIAQLQEVTRYE